MKTTNNIIRNKHFLPEDWNILHSSCENHRAIRASHFLGYAQEEAQIIDGLTFPNDPKGLCRDYRWSWEENEEPLHDMDGGYYHAPDPDEYPTDHQLSPTGAPRYTETEPELTHPVQW
jgi:hypothetical protein